MKSLESLKNRSQESLAHLVDLGKQQPEQVQHWSVTAATAVAGALVVAAVAKGMLGVIATLAYPPVALTAGALGGGVFVSSGGSGATASQAHSASRASRRCAALAG